MHYRFRKVTPSGQPVTLLIETRDGRVTGGSAGMQWAIGKPLDMVARWAGSKGYTCEVSADGQNWVPYYAGE